MPIPPDPPVLLTELLDHLVAAELVQRRTDSSPSTLPIMILEARDGIPSPADLDRDAVLGAWLDGGIPSKRHESSLTTDKVEFVLRTRRPYLADAIYRQLRAELVDRRGWQMAGRTIVESLELRKLQRLGSNADGYSHDFALLFTTYA